MSDQNSDLRRPTPTKDKKRSSLVWIILNIVQLAVIGFMLVLWMDQTEKIESLEKSLNTSEEEVTKKTHELFELRDEYIRIKKEKKKMGLDLQDLNMQIEELDNLIQTLQTDKKNALAKVRNLDAKIASMKKDIAAKDAEIAQLKEENDSLYVEIDTLNVEKQQLTENLEEVEVTNEELNKFIKAASVLKTDDIIVSALKSNGKEVMRDEYRSGMIDRMRIRFRLLDNRAAKKEKKTFYIRLITPSGKVFSDEYNGGGTTTLHDGEEVEYTMSQTIDFNNTGQELMFTMLKGFNYKDGNYIIEVLCEGHMIGQGYFIVK